MNVSGWARGMMSKSMETEPFFNHVMKCVETELGEAGDDVILLYDWASHTRDMEMMLILNGRVISFGITKAEIERRKESSPFSLDWLIWSELVRRGVEVKETHYMGVIFPGKE